MRRRWRAKPANAVFSGTTQLASQNWPKLGTQVLSQTRFQSNCREQSGRFMAALFFEDLRAVLLVLRKHLEDVLVGEKVVRHTNRERPRVHRWIIERHLDVEVTEITSSESFSDAELVAMWS